MTDWLLNYAINALWQVPLLFAAAWLAARLLRPAGALVEYRIWFAAAVLEAVLPACPAAAFLRLPFRPESHGHTTSVTIRQGPYSLHTGWHVAPAFLLAIALVYLAFLLYAALRLLRGYGLTVRLRRQAVLTALSGIPAELWDACREHFHLPSTTLAESSALQTPITLGLHYPTILFPTGLLSTLDPDDLQTILAHESAHIARNDFAWNLLLQAITLPIAFHPLAHLTLARLTESREIVCDRLAAEAMSTPLHNGSTSYARSLLRLASALLEVRSARPAHAIGIGIFDAHTLERRIMSLTHNTPRPTLLRRAALLATALTLLCAASVTAVALRTTVVPADPVKVQSGVMAGQIRIKTTPKYPQAAKDAHIQGAVLLHAIIGKDGVIDKLTVISGPPELTSSALDAVRQWVYEPYLLNGEPTEVETTITINYSLGN